MTSPKLKALIVDDEYPARAELRFLLQGFADRVQIIGEATHATEALALLEAMPYDIVFLDIDMPELNGLEVARLLQNKPSPPYVIFVTAYQEFALQAFEVNAVDYLLKPFDEQRLGQALAKVFRQVEKAQAAGSQASPSPAPGTAPPPAAAPARTPALDRLLAERKGKTALIDKKDVIYAFVRNNVLYLKLFNEALMTRYTMKELVRELPEPTFVRTHRQYLVNLRRVREVIPYFNGTFSLVVDDAERSEVPVSRAQAKRIRAILGM
ncbi:MAG: LytTR family DNA-binding domain-containing protein [Bacillota bacterium]|nr:LytTR family DNA-binding domain-containing protein [Bacillota bacterium]